MFDDHHIDPRANTSWFDHQMAGSPVMAVLRGLSPDESVRLAVTAWESGCENVEIPIETPAAIPALKAVIRAGRERNRLVGAGTILNLQQLDQATQLGAAYLVSPGFDTELVAAASSRGIPFLPGVSTPSEILAAYRAGLRWLKAFPASVLGPKWVTAMLGPFPDIHFVATGGMNAHNAAEFLQAGCTVVGVGSALSDPTQAAAIRDIVHGRF